MSNPSAHVMAAVYESDEQAKTVLDMLKSMHRNDTITLIDAAIVSKDAEGKIHVKETSELTGRKGARRGAIVTGIIGLIYPPSFIASALAGGGIGALIGKMRDTGIKNDQLKEIAGQVDAGKSAVVALAEDEWVPAIENALKAFDTPLIVQPLSDEDLKQIYVAEEQSR